MTRLDETRKMDRTLSDAARALGNLFVDGFHFVALFAIGGAVVWSAVGAFAEMAARGSATLDDILLLFIYLELGAMVGIYFKTYHMPVRFLLYVSITALTRVLIVVIDEEHKQPDETLLYVCGAILLLALSTLVIRFGSHRFPSAGPGERDPAKSAPPDKGGD